MKWNYTELYAKADEFEQRLPQMIEEEKWFEIREMLSTMLDHISGKTAEAFQRAIEGSYKDHNVSIIKSFPEVIRNACKEMQKRDAANADRIHDSFRGF